MKTEIKTRQTTVLFRPSLYKDLQRLAAIHKWSMNGLIGNVLEEYVAKNRELLKTIVE